MYFYLKEGETYIERERESMNKYVFLITPVKTLDVNLLSLLKV